MNERIKELIEQSVTFRLDPDSKQYEAQVCPEELEYLVESVVRECCAQVERQYKYSNGTPVSFWEMSQDVQDLLKEHFGVEE